MPDRDLEGLFTFHERDSIYVQDLKRHDALVRNESRVALERLKRGLPKHPRCGCQECADWRSKNWDKIQDLNWD